MDPTASIVIPPHNQSSVIGRLLAAILDGVPVGDYEVLVVANGCTDGTVDVAAAVPGVRVLETE